MGMVVHTYNPSNSEDSKFQDSLSNLERLSAIQHDPKTLSQNKKYRRTGEVTQWESASGFNP